MKKIRIKDRITAALSASATKWRSHYDLMADVFPPSEYPNAWRYASGGGPPGCAMAFGRALREMRDAKLIDSNFTGRGYTSEYSYRLLSKRSAYA